MEGPGNFICSFCGETMVGKFIVYQKVSGWERWRDEGGTNALALRKTEQVFACERCIGLEKRGINSKAQATLV